MKLFSTSGFQLSYQRIGQGVPVLVIGSAQYDQAMFAADLYPGIEFIFLDQRTHGLVPSSVSAADFSLQAIVADMEAFRERLGFESWAVLGHSGNGYLAMSYAKAFPQRVSHLLLSAVSPDLSEATFAAADAHWQADASAKRQARFAEQMALLGEDLAEDPSQKMMHLCRRMGPKRWFDSHFDEKPLWKGVRSCAMGFDTLWGQAFKSPTWFDVTAPFEMPTWISLGRYDYSYPPASCWAPYRSYFKHLQIRVFEASGHTPFYEEPEVFAANLRAFVLPESLKSAANP